MERALIWILTPTASGGNITSSSTCWHRNIMVHKCFCATKQIRCSEYTAKNQTICFKRTQELLKPSWNSRRESCSSTNLRGRLALFFHHMRLRDPSQPACIAQQCCFQWEGTLPSLSPKGSARWSWALEKKGIKLLGFNLLFIENWFWHCLMLFLDYTLRQNEMGALKDYFIPGVPNTSSHSSTEVSSIHSSFCFPLRICPIATSTLICSLK